MKLSEAIRLGAMLKPQRFGYGQIWGSFNRLSSCALEAAVDAIGEESLGGYGLPGVYPWMDVLKSRKCPACGSLKHNSTMLIIHLNDDHRWNRERIADFVSTIEPPDPEPAQPEPVPAVETVEA